ncbi:MAG: 50S ribosomal protein L23 [Candidatus Portnoybacteria bacterium CG_4_10_14_0_8_um_filter_40_50]|uniref:Large ribosomal subunit protein uL23 n=2 Tax=Candidatus Portnoyibacteriota TaxID=1817913 RepID=A0A2M7QPK5_9BACT|nr:MAG: 50S ribosomal protein L23 [Candidatus Portnoybacteria bacterium CG_4_10_14_0_8_um_filter_40_50]
MSIFDRFKKTKKGMRKAEIHVHPVRPRMSNGAGSAHANEKAVKKEEVKEAEMKEIKEEKAIKLPKRVEKKAFSDAWRILESPHVTEKSGMLAEKNHYVFKVSPSANKQQIKQAVQDLYGVAVEKVRIINIPRKARRLGKSQGFKPGFRKAMVKLIQGEKIEIMPR